MKRLILIVVGLTALATSLVLLGTGNSAKAEPIINKIKANETELYDSIAGRRFVPRGANFIRLAQASDGSVYHSTFEPGRYDPAKARLFLDGMKRDQNNTVRVFIDPGAANVQPHGIGRGIGTHDIVYGPYMDNFADFASEAAVRGVYVVPSLDYFPTNSYYWDIVARETVGSANMDGQNISYLERGRVLAKAEYMKQFAAELVNRIGVDKKNVILAYQSDNEMFYEANKPPYDKLSGTVTSVDGVTYDMSQPAQRQQSADASLVVYSSYIKQALIVSDPDALLVTGFFTNNAVGKTTYNGLMTYCSTACSPTVDYRVPGRPAALSIYGSADFLDIHLYPNTNPYNPVSELSSVEKSLFTKPFIIGEVGARKTVYNNSIATAAYGTRDTRVATCKEGARGWLYWTQDTYEDLASQGLFYKLNETSGAINGQMAPVQQPDPCTTYVVAGLIRAQWDILDMQYGVHGWATTTDASTTDGRARFNSFQSGGIYLKNGDTSAKSVRGAIYTKWSEYNREKGTMKLPTTSETAAADGIGRYNHFENGSIYWTTSIGAHAVHGAISTRWAGLGREQSYLGYPTTEEFNITGGRRSNFQSGYITWNSSTGAVVDRRY